MERLFVQMSNVQKLISFIETVLLSTSNICFSDEN